LSGAKGSQAGFFGEAKGSLGWDNLSIGNLQRFSLDPVRKKQRGSAKDAS
jgi:hypothetical protein